jgi:hypothetical protein
LFYENIPILGSIIRFVKKKIAADKWRQAFQFI